MNKYLCIIALFVSSHAFADENHWNLFTHEDGWAVISNDYHKGGTLSRAIKAIPKNVRLKHVSVFPITVDNRFQNEINNFLAKNYADLHAQALKSAGNMHNPKIRALRVPYKKAVMASSRVKELNTALAYRCERVSSVSFEKLHIRKEGERPIYTSIMWLHIKQCD